MTKPRELRSDEMLRALHAAGRLDAFAFAEHAWGPEPRALADARACGDELAGHRLARWADPEHTILELSPFGRFWMNEGGYLAFLKSNDARPATGGRGGRGDGDGSADPEFRKAFDDVRMKLMQRRLKTFWWGFGFSVVSLVFSILSLYLAITGKK